MRVAILGGTSMIGGRTAALLRRSHDVLTVGRAAGDDLAVDLDDVASTAGVNGAADVLVHAAAAFGGDAPADAATNERTNAAGAFVAADVARRLGCRRVVYVGSISSYDEPANQYFGSYGLSKRHAEENLALWCGRADVAFLSLRLGAVYDERGDARRHQPMLYGLLDRARAGQPIEVWGAEDVERSFMFVDDVAALLVRAVEATLAGVRPAAARPSRMSEIARLALLAYGRDEHARFLPDKPALKTIYIPDSRATFDALAFTPAVDLADGMRRIRDAASPSS